MTECPKVSVITPTLNQARFIEETIQSVRAQRYPSLEHVIIDGGSTDGTLDILRSYPRLVWQTVPHLNQSQSINKAYSISTGEIIGWINSDDRYAPGAVRTAVDFLVAHADVDIVYGDIDFIDEEGRFAYRRREIGADYQIFLAHGAYILHNAAFIRRRVFEKVGRIDEGLDCCMDYDFLLRAMKGGCVIRRIPFIMGNFRLHTERKSIRRADALNREFELVKRRYRRARFPARYLENFYNALLDFVFKCKRIFMKLIHGCYFEPGYIKFLLRLLLFGQRI